MTFTAHLRDRVNKISEHVRSKTKVPVQDQVPQLGPKTLKPQRTLSSYGIDKEMTVQNSEFWNMSKLLISSF